MNFGADNFGEKSKLVLEFGKNMRLVSSLNVPKLVVRSNKKYVFRRNATFGAEGSN